MTSQELIYLAKDIDIDLTIKLFLLITLFVYLVGMIYFSKLNDTDRYYQIIIKVFFMKVPGYILLFYYPLNALFIYREVAASTLFSFIGGFYAIYTSLMIIIMVAFGTDFLLRMVGIDMGSVKTLKRGVKQTRFSK